MEHREAIELKAAERYVLRELPVELRDAYEEHFFDCAECAAEIKAATIFAETSREIFAEERPQPTTDINKIPGSMWWSWLRPTLGLPVFAALLVMIGYQNLVTIPRLKSGSAATVQVLNSFPLAAANSRGATVRIAVRRGESFALTFDIPPGKNFPEYLCQLRDASGRVLRQISVTAEQANKSVELFIPAGMMLPGTYSIVIAGDADHSVQIHEDKKFDPLGFTVVFEN